MQTEDLTAVPHRGLITVCAMMATLMQALDSTIANVALPYMQGSLSASYDQITWVLTSYITAAAIMTAPVGWLSNRFGRKNLFIVSLIGFTVTSMLCGVATSLTEMVLFRLLQGVFGAALVPLSQAVMLDIYPVEQRGSAMAIWGMGVMVGPILGPTLGGYLTEFYNWRFVFFVNLPFGVLATIGLMLFLPRTRPREARFDWTGFLMFAVGIAAPADDAGPRRDEGLVQLPRDHHRGGCWPGWGCTCSWCTCSPRAEAPFITPRIFKDRNLNAGLLVMFAVGLVLLAVSALLAPWLQTLGGYPVETAGLMMAPRGIGTMMAMMIAGRLTNKVDPRALMAFGILVLSWSLYRMTGWTPAVDETEFVVNTIIQGFGLGFVFIPLQVIAFATLEPALRTEGTALLSLTRNIGSAVGISITEALLIHNTQMRARRAQPASCRR